MKISATNISIEGLDKLNILIGKNGCGKSTILRRIDGLKAINDKSANVKYLPPERGGSVAFNPNIESNISSNPDWLTNSRRKNQFANSREVSISLFRKLELGVLRKFEKDQSLSKFDEYIDRINKLLDRIELVRVDNNESIEYVDKKTKNPSKAIDLSSGESELISLAMEILAFETSVDITKENLLVIDEPEVHLHPDLQHRFTAFVIDSLKKANYKIVISTHSTSILSGAVSYQGARVCFMKPRQEILLFSQISTEMQSIVPIFGPHPLSSVFLKLPLLLVEGDDDLRVWQQAVRSSQGKLRLFPVSVDGKGNFEEFETKTNEIIDSLTDDGKAFSIRDGDGITEELLDVGRVTRFRLSCREIENLLVCDEAFSRVGISFDELLDRLKATANRTPEHKQKANLESFVKSKNRTTDDIKEIRNVILAEMGITKPWEVFVGQLIVENIGSLKTSPTPDSLRNYLGAKFASFISENFSAP